MPGMQVFVCVGALTLRGRLAPSDLINSGDLLDWAGGTFCSEGLAWEGSVRGRRGVIRGGVHGMRGLLVLCALIVLD